MASLGQPFDPNTVEPGKGGGGGALVPVGDHEFEMRISDVKPNSKGSGTVAKFEAFHTGRDAPELKDRRVFVNINLTHTSAQAQSIGQGEFSALCAAIGETGTVEDTEQLHYRPFHARVEHEQAQDWKQNGKPMFKDDGSPLMNAVIKRFLFDDGEAPPAANDPPANKPAPQQQAASTATGGAAPARSWQRKAS